MPFWPQVIAFTRPCTSVPTPFSAHSLLDLCDALRSSLCLVLSSLVPHKSLQAVDVLAAWQHPALLCERQPCARPRSPTVQLLAKTSNFSLSEVALMSFAIFHPANFMQQLLEYTAVIPLAFRDQMQVPA